MSTALKFADNFWSPEGEEGYNGLIAKLSMSIESMREFNQLLVGRFTSEELYAVEVLRVINEYDNTEIG